MLVQGVPNTQALVKDYFGDRQIKLKSTTMLCIRPGNPNFLGFLGLEINTGQFRPVLDDSERVALLPLSEWWETEPVLNLVNKKDATMTRKEIVMSTICGDLVTLDTQAKLAELRAGTTGRFAGCVWLVI